MRRVNQALVLLMAASCPTLVSAQYRPNMPPVVVPEQAPPVANVADPAELLQRRYAAAGRPRIGLFWNVALSDALANRERTVETTTKSTSGSKTSLQQSTTGPAGDATQRDEDTSSKSAVTTTRDLQWIDDGKRHRGPGEAPAAVLENAFTSELNKAGLVIVDRALTMRKTAASRHAPGVDAKRVETDALTETADLLLEVLMIEDKQAPGGWGFNVRMKNVRQGTLMFAFYTTATPPARVTPGRWITNETGFAYQPGETLPGTVGDIGTALAHKLMQRLADQLPSNGGIK